MVGSGISKRFVESFQTWDELLMSVAERFGVNSDRYQAIRLGVIQDLDDPSASSDTIAMNVASKLSRMLIECFEKGLIDPSALLNGSDLDQYRHGVDPFKLLVCSGMRNVSFKQSNISEIQCFKKLKDSVPAIITTNYDTVLETLFDGEFKVFNDVDEYFGADEFGIGEIHKMYGTIKKPRSIVLTREDYDAFYERSSIVSSKIISLMCDSPSLLWDTRWKIRSYGT